MLILDANMILRFLLKDNEEMAQEAKRNIESGNAYANENLDFVDCMLYAYNRIDGAQIATFDKKLLKLIERQ